MFSSFLFLFVFLGGWGEVGVYPNIDICVSYCLWCVVLLCYVQCEDNAIINFWGQCYNKYISIKLWKITDMVSMLTEHQSKAMWRSHSNNTGHSLKTQADFHTHAHNTYTHVYACVCVYVRVQVYVCVCIYVSVLVHPCTYTHTHAHSYKRKKCWLI